MKKKTVSRLNPNNPDGLEDYIRGILWDIMDECTAKGAGIDILKVSIASQNPEHEDLMKAYQKKFNQQNIGI